VYNSLAAVAAGIELDVPFAKIAKALSRFHAVDRRFQLKGEAFGATVVDDYGHHPTEIQATLAAAREGFGVRTVVVFQPHRYSRTQALLEEFGRAFVLADRVSVTDVYAAGEAPITGIDGKAVADALVRHGHPAVSYEPKASAIPKALRGIVSPGDLVITLGAGDVWKTGEAFIALGAAPRRGRRAGGAS
jgi:UDP-N-acetylmuramate--alanine ligase